MPTFRRLIATGSPSVAYQMMGVSVDGSDNVYFNARAIPQSGHDYGIVGKFNSSGALQWITRPNNGSSEENAYAYLKASKVNVGLLCWHRFEPSGSISFNPKISRLSSDKVVSSGFGVTGGTNINGLLDAMRS